MEGRFTILHMRRGLTKTAILVTAWLLASQETSSAQETAARPSPQVQSRKPCSSSSPSNVDQPSEPETSIVEVTFSGSLHMPISDQDEIAASIKQRTRGRSLDGVTDGALERARLGWQDRGYFKVQVTGDAATLSSRPAGQRIALHVRVDEGTQYRLSGITFNNNHAIGDIERLRGLFPIKDGDVFSRERISMGMEHLREAYGKLGYINFTSLPDTKLDDENGLLSLAVGLDEGKQFRVGTIDVLGLKESTRDELLRDLPIQRGQIFSSKLWEESLLKYASMFPGCACRDSEQRHLDEKVGVVMVTLDFRPCPQN